MPSPDSTKRRRVAVDITILDRVKTGSAVYVRELIEAIEQLRPTDLEIIPLRGPSFIARKNILTKFINLGIELWWLHRRLPSLVRRLKIELLHMPANVIPLHVPCACVVTIYDANFMKFPEEYDPLWRRYARLMVGYAARRADRVITISSTAKRDILTFFPADPEKICVISPGIKSFSAQAATVSGESDQEFARRLKPYLLYVGATEPHKNLRRLLEVFGQLIHDPTFSHLKLVIAGAEGRDHQTLIALSDQRGLREKVILTGHLPEARLASLYREASVFVFPSLTEGFGMPPLEAMQMGVPVVASNIPVLLEVLGDAAIYFDPTSTASISSALRQALGDEPLRAEMIQRGRRQVERYSWTAMATAIINLYREILRDRS
jgi:glycosyltransferase involved in cell wall biosynthesis